MLQAPFGLVILSELLCRRTVDHAMSLDKAIAHGKERRRPYYGRGESDPTCRPHGGKRGGHAWYCKWCLGARMFKHMRKGIKPKGKCC